MKFHGITLEQGSNVSNLTVAAGTSFPASPDEGEMFYRSDSAVNVKGLYVYINGSWDRLASSDSLTAPSGATLPSVQNDGDLFYLNTDDSNEGLYVYNGGAWVTVGAGAPTVFTVTGDVTGTLDGGTDVLTLSSTGVSANTYGSSTHVGQFAVDAKGRITDASNVAIAPDFASIINKPTTLAGYGITDAQALDATLTALAAYSTNGIVVQTAVDTFAGRSIAVSGSGLSITNADGVSGNPTITLASATSATANTVVLRDGTASFSAFDVNLSGSLTIAPSGAGALTIMNVAPTYGAYTQLRRSGSTRWSAGMSSATETGSDAGSDWILQSHTDAGAPKSVVISVSRATGDVTFSNDVFAASFNGPLVGNASTATALATGRTFSVSGDATGASAAFDGTAAATIPLTLATVNANVGSFGSASSVATFTVNGKGLITTAGNTSIAIPTSAVTSGTFADARIAQSSVTQHQAALTILESQITDGSVLARNAANETISGNWTFSNNVSVPLVPTQAAHAASKDYVDNVAAGINVHAAVRAATTGNITLSGTQTIDGVSLVAGDRVLVKDQTTGSQNGVYVVAAGAWTRATDFDGSPSNEVTNGDLLFVTDGTTNGDTSWVLVTTGSITIGTTALQFTLFSKAVDVVGGAGLTKTGNTLDVGTASASRIVVNANNIDLATVGTAGTYNRVTTDAYGRVTSGTNNVTGTGTTFVLNTGPTISNATLTTTATFQDGSIFTSWTASDTDIDGLISGSTSGTLIESVNAAHFTIGLRSNDVNDGFQIISKGAATTPATDPYTTLAFEVKATGDVTYAGDAVGNALTLNGNPKQLVINRNGSQYIAIQNNNTTVSPLITSFSSTGNAKRLQFRSTTTDADDALTSGSLGFDFKIYSANVLSITADGVEWTGVASGNGSGITNLNASNISSGTITDGRLSSNVALRNATNTFTNYQNITHSTAGGNTEVLRLNPTDYGVGKPGLYFKTGSVANNWIIGLWDTVGSSGSIALAASTVNLAGAVTTTSTLAVGTNLNVAGLGLFADGTAAAPSISFASDTDTGIYRRASNQLGITTAGTEAAYFDASGNTNIVGNLGVKSSTPSTSAAINSSITLSANGSRYGMNNALVIDDTAALTTDRAVFGAYNLVEVQLQNPAAFSLSAHGAYNYARTNANGGNSADGEGQLIGSFNLANHQSSDATYTRMENLYGTYSEARLGGATAIGDNVYGTWSLVNAAVAGSTANTAFGVRSRVQASNATATVNTGYLYYGDFSVTGTVSNRYGLYIPTSSAYNFVAGGFQIGGTAQTAGTSGIPGLGVGVAPTGTAGTIISSGQHLTYSGDTASAPGFSWAGDTDTGFYSPSAGNIAVTTNGTEAMRFTSSNQILVGHTAALSSRVATTTVTPTIQTPGTSANASSILQARYSASAGAPYQMFGKSRSGTVGSHTIVVNGDPLGVITFAGSDGTQFTEGARIEANVDGTPGANSMPSELKFYTNPGGTTTPGLALTLAANNTATFAGAVTAPSFSGSGASLTSLNASNLASGTVPDARLSGTYTGVSITGNAATATTLQTARTIGLSGVTATATSFNGSANITIPVTAVPASLLTGTIADARISGAYSGITTLSISGKFTTASDIDCEVGINGGYGTTNGTGTNWGASMWAIGDAFDGSGLGTAFTVTNHYGAAWLRASHASASTFIGEGMYIYQAGTLRAGMGTGGIYSANTASATSATTGSIVAAGGIGCTNLYASGEVTAYSDARIKTDIEVIPDALKKVEAIRGVTYTRTDNGDLEAGKRSTGVIAQEVLEVLPEAVVVNKEDPEALMGVNYGNMAGLLIEAIKELSEQNKAMAAEIAELKSIINRG